MYTTLVKFTPLYDGDPAEHQTTHEVYEDAQLYGLRSSCMGGVTEVFLYNEEKELIEYYNSISNIWHTFLGDDGKVVSRADHFKKIAHRVQKEINNEGLLPVYVHGAGAAWLVEVGEHRIPLDDVMLNVVSSILERLHLEVWRREDMDMAPYSDEELVERTASRIIQTLAERLANSPGCYSRVRERIQALNGEINVH
jgi:hypothetical protein